MDSDNQPIITREISVIRLVMFVGIIVGLGAGLLAFTTARDTRSRASVPKPSPLILSLPSPVPSPRTDLTPPYLRLVSAKGKYGFKENVSVDIYLHTGGKEVMEADILLTYDADILEINKADIIKTETFKVLNIEDAERGHISLTLFVDPSLDQKPVNLGQEAKIASLNFKTLTLTKPVTDVKIVFNRTANTTSMLVPYTKSRPEKPEDILASVESLTLSVGP